VGRKGKEKLEQKRRNQ